MVYEELDDNTIYPVTAYAVPELQKNIRLFACYHFSPGTISRNRDLQTQKRDWKRIAIALKQ
jgi:hypothetical protein